jgi:hypothetical protein
VLALGSGSPGLEQEHQQLSPAGERTVVQVLVKELLGKGNALHSKGKSENRVRVGS